jgi:hypothetical protein
LYCSNYSSHYEHKLNTKRTTGSATRSTIGRSQETRKETKGPHGSRRQCHVCPSIIELDLRAHMYRHISRHIRGYWHLTQRHTSSAKSRKSLGTLSIMSPPSMESPASPAPSQEEKQARHQRAVAASLLQIWNAVNKNKVGWHHTRSTCGQCLTHRSAVLGSLVPYFVRLSQRTRRQDILPSSSSPWTCLRSKKSYPMAYVAAQLLGVGGVDRRCG